jgi:diamine N-acetyltransferase
MDSRPQQEHVDLLTLKRVGAGEWRDVAGLEVTSAQRAFVAEPAYYLAMCAYDAPWQPLAVLLDERVVGFVMWAVDPSDGSCWLGGLLIDQRHQRRGYGRRAVEAALAMLSGEHGHRRFALTYAPDNPAKGLYAALGFRETGERDGDEVVARLTLPGASAAAG